MAENKYLKTTKKLLSSLGVEAKIKITEEEDIISVSLETEDSGIVIGYHGETLEALQIVLALMLAKETGEFKRVSIEVGDYKKNREAWLEKLALDAKERVLSGEKEVYLTDLKAWERRVVHMVLQSDDQVGTESSGEGKERVLVIKPK
jgi:spoIIIJ-associated protein